MPVAMPVNIDLLMEEIKSLPVDYTAQVLDFVGYLKDKAAKQEDCSIHGYPETGNPRYNAKAFAAIAEAEAMINGEIPV